MTMLEPSERAVVAAVVGDDVMAQDEDALGAARGNYLRTVSLLQRHPWRAAAPQAATPDPSAGSTA